MLYKKRLHANVARGQRKAKRATLEGQHDQCQGAPAHVIAYKKRKRKHEQISG